MRGENPAQTRQFCLQDSDQLRCLHLEGTSQSQHLCAPEKASKTQRHKLHRRKTTYGSGERKGLVRHCSGSDADSCPLQVKSFTYRTPEPGGWLLVWVGWDLVLLVGSGVTGEQHVIITPSLSPQRTSHATSYLLTLTPGSSSRLQTSMKSPRPNCDKGHPPVQTQKAISSSTALGPQA